MATQHKEIDAKTLENLLYLSRLSPSATNMEILKKQVDDIVGYFEILSNMMTVKIRMMHIRKQQPINSDAMNLKVVLKCQM